MPKHIIEFNLPEENEELDTTLKASKMSIALFDIQNELFRPSWKHGYSDETLQKLCENEDVQKAIEILHKKFIEILEENDVLSQI